MTDKQTNLLSNILLKSECNLNPEEELNMKHSPSDYIKAINKKHESKLLSGSKLSPEDSKSTTNEDPVMADTSSSMDNVRQFVQNTCREINMEEEVLVNLLLNGESDKREIIAKIDWCTFTRYSIRKLNVGTWLNDEIINFAMLLFNQEQHEKCNEEPKFYCFNSYFIENY